jgi:hypothetical protein
MIVQMYTLNTAGLDFTKKVFVAVLEIDTVKPFRRHPMEYLARTTSAPDPRFMGGVT